MKRREDTSRSDFEEGSLRIVAIESAEMSSAIEVAIRTEHQPRPWLRTIGAGFLRAEAVQYCNDPLLRTHEHSAAVVPTGY